MKLELGGDWFRRRIPLEWECETAVGPPADASAPAGADALLFGAFVQLLRRARRMSVEGLADAVGAAPTELIRIEHEARHVPSTHLVERLSKVFGLPSAAMVKLSRGNHDAAEPLGGRAVEFAAEAAKIRDLSRDETIALAEFEQFLRQPSRD